MKKFVLVDRDTLEIYVNQFNGDLPPMTEEEIKHYFNEDSILEISKKHRVILYEVNDKVLCPHCKAPLTRSDTKGYDWQCFYCNEDFYKVEVIKRRGK